MDNRPKIWLSEDSPQQDADGRPKWRSTAALASLLLCVLSWELDAAILFGRWLFGPNWFGLQRVLLALSVSVTLSVFHWFWGRPLLRKHFRPGDQSKRSLTVVQAAIVIVMMVGAGA